MGERTRRQRGRRPKKTGNKQGVSGANFEREAKAKAEERFFGGVEGIPDSLDPPPKLIEIKWNVRGIPPETENLVSKWVVKRGEWGWMPQNQVDRILDQLNGIEMNLDQALSLRKALLQQKSVRRHRMLLSEAKKISLAYENGESILSIAKRRDFPPLNVMRHVLLNRGWSKKRVKEAMQAPDKRLSQRDLEQFIEANDADRVSSVDQSETHKRADKFEQVLIEYVESHGVRVRPQAELVEEQVAKHGRAMRTPDLLILDRLRINGRDVAWIDAKHYYGANLDFPVRKTRKQVKRYIEMWGQGAVVYRHGFNSSMRIPGTLLLDAEPLDLALMNEA